MVAVDKLEAISARDPIAGSNLESAVHARGPDAKRLALRWWLWTSNQRCGTEARGGVHRPSHKQRGLRRDAKSVCPAIDGAWVVLYGFAVISVGVNGYVDIFCNQGDYSSRLRRKECRVVNSDARARS